MAGTAPFGLRCPDCDALLRSDRTKMNVEVDVCPDGHGIFLDRSDIEALVGPAATRDIQMISGRSKDVAGSCPNCTGRFRHATVNHVPVTGCSQCGALWFATSDLREHVNAVRTRAYGAGSMAARADVMRDATSFMPSEIAAGILADYQLERGL